MLSKPVSRRRFVLGASTILTASMLPWQGVFSQSMPSSDIPMLTGRLFELTIGYQSVNFTGQKRLATTVNGSLPAPTLRWKQGEKVTIRVTNTLAEETSIHWHGIILPSNMDGVPGLSFNGIKPGETFEYEFEVNQSGTYWYHSHSGFQEQTGLYGAIIIDPIESQPVKADRDFVITLSDWTDDDPEHIYSTLKKHSDFYNRQERTLFDTWQDIKENGIAETWQQRKMWNDMLMSDRDISDVTGATYTFLMNGQTPEQGWTGLFEKGDKVRLRFINAAAMTLFDVRIPGVKMTVVSADGQDVEPVTVDDFRIGVAETYDVIVEPEFDMAHVIFAQAIDRSGFACGVLTSDVRLKAEMPVLDPVPILTMNDMGMDHSGMTMGNDSSHTMMMHHHHDMSHMTDKLGKAGFGSQQDIKHAETEYGPHVDMRAEMPSNKLNDPGIGLREHASKYGRRVLTYADLRNLNATPDPREPEREIQLHLTGNMSRYMWSINGIKYADADPIELRYGERVRFHLVNDTMMNHPMHLHGMWSDLETGQSEAIPRKHTVIVQPGSQLSYLVTADARGRWAYHCHLMFHMLSMFREVRVS
jgi:CopA family copper-resistance protein